MFRVLMINQRLMNENAALKREIEDQKRKMDAMEVAHVALVNATRDDGISVDLATRVIAGGPALF